MRFARSFAALVVTTVAFAVAPAVAGATAIHVTSFADNATGCTLRNAIVAANNNVAVGTCAAGQAGPTVDTIDFPSANASTITLTSGLPQVTGPLTIFGPGTTQLTISGADSVQPLSNNSPALTVSGLTITAGRCGPTCGDEGGAIINFSTLTLDSVVVSNSTAIDQNGGTDNFAEGGGIENNNAAILHVINSRITGNTATAGTASSQNGSTGGGIMNRGTLTVTNSTVSGNTATSIVGVGATGSVAGGAIDNNGSLTITDSTLSGNAASGSGPVASTVSGGAIAQFNNPANVLKIVGSTIADNSAAGGTGGGLISIGAPGSLSSSTVSGNTATSGANIVVQAPLTMTSSIVTNPKVGPNCQGMAVTSGGFNIESTNTCALNKPTDKTNINPQLGALADNGGPTQTLLPQTGSPAIDQGKAAAGEVLDQRGLTRPVENPTIANATGGDGSDIGSVEIQNPDTTITSGTADGSVAGKSQTFAFSSNVAAATFECSVDGAAFAACTSPDVLSLKDGQHSFAVRATAGGFTDPTPATRSFTVDATAPKIKLGKFKKKTTKPKVKLKFSSEKGATFECRVDKKQFKTCKSPYKTKKLKPGKHVVQIEATDAAGNVGKPAKAKFKVLS